MSKVSSALEFFGLKSKDEMVFQNATVAAYFQGIIKDKELKRRIGLANIKSNNMQVQANINSYHKKVESEVKENQKQKGYRTNLLQLSSSLKSDVGNIKKDQKETLKKVLEYFDFNATCYEDNKENKAFLKHETLSGIASAPRKGLLFSFKNIHTPFKKTAITLTAFENGKETLPLTLNVLTENKTDIAMLRKILTPKETIWGKEYLTLTNENYLTLMTIAKKNNPEAKFPVDASANEVFLASSCKEYLDNRKKLDAEEFTIVETDTFYSQLIGDLKNYIAVELGKKRSEKGKAALNAIQTYLTGFEKIDKIDGNFEKNVNKLGIDLTKALNGIVQKRTWESYFWSFYSPVPKIASLVAQYKDGINNHIQKKIKKEEAAVTLHNETEKDKADLETFRSQEKIKNGSESRDFLQELANLRETNHHQELSEIVTQQWNGITISKDDFLETMAKIKDSIDNDTSLHHEQIDFTHYRPNNEDVAEKNDEQDRLKPIEEHFMSIIEKAKNAANASDAEDFSAQLQDVQRKLNFLLLHRHVAGQKVQTLISDNTQEQFDKKRKEFNTIISATKHAAVKPVVWVDVDALKKEIIRLKDFYSLAKDALSSLHKQLSATKKNNFANEVEELILSKESETSCMGTRIDQLEAHLRMLEAFPNEKYDANHSSNNRQHLTTLKIMDELKKNCKALTDSSVVLIQTIQDTVGVTRHEKLQAAIQTVKSFFVDNSENVLETECFRDNGIISSENESELTINDSGRANDGVNSFFKPHNSDRDKKSSLLVCGGF